jgi:hypothetical protein
LYALPVRRREESSLLSRAVFVIGFKVALVPYLGEHRLTIQPYFGFARHGAPFATGASTEHSTLVRNKA